MSHSLAMAFSESLNVTSPTQATPFPTYLLCVRLFCFFSFPSSFCYCFCDSCRPSSWLMSRMTPQSTPFMQRNPTFCDLHTAFCQEIRMFVVIKLDDLISGETLPSMVILYISDKKKTHISGYIMLFICMRTINYTRFA